MEGLDLQCSIKSFSSLSLVASILRVAEGVVDQRDFGMEMEMGKEETKCRAVLDEVD